MKKLYLGMAGIGLLVASCMPYKHASVGLITPLDGEQNAPRPSATVSAEYGAGNFGGRVTYFQSTHYDGPARLDTDSVMIDFVMRKHFGNGAFVKGSLGDLIENPTATLPSGTQIPLDATHTPTAGIGVGFEGTRVVSAAELKIILGDNVRTAAELLVGVKF